MEIIFNTLELSYKSLPMKDKKQMRSALWFPKLSALREVPAEGGGIQAKTSWLSNLRWVVRSRKPTGSAEYQRTAWRKDSWHLQKILL